MGVTLFRIVKDVSVDIHKINRWNLADGGKLDYAPDPAFTHVNLRFKPNKSDLLDITKYAIPLGTWHNAYMSKNSEGKFYWRF